MAIKMTESPDRVLERIYGEITYLFSKVDWKHSFLDAKAATIMYKLHGKLQYLANKDWSLGRVDFEEARKSLKFLEQHMDSEYPSPLALLAAANKVQDALTTAQREIVNLNVIREELERQVIEGKGGNHD